jgi:hypothetical protein
VTSTDIALVVPDTLLDVRSGELVPATPAKAVELLGAARDMRARILDLVKDCEAVLLEESRLQGTKTLHLDGGTAEITGGAGIDWNLGVLTELLDLGLPQARYDDLVTEVTTYKVDARVAKQLEASNENYAEVIERARIRVEKPWRVSVK